MKKKYIVIFFVVIFFITPALASVTIESRDEQIDNIGNASIRIRITNNSQDTLQNVQLKYFFKIDPNKIVKFDSLYLPNVSASLELNDSVSGIVNIFIPTLYPGVFPNLGGIAFGLHYLDWSDFEKGDDYSYPNSNNFHEVDNIPVLLNDALFSGAFPGVLSNAEPFILDSGSEILLDSNEKIHFAWREVDGASSYRLNVVSVVDSSIIMQKVTEYNYIDTTLVEGEYLWNVEASEYGVGDVRWNKPIKSSFTWHGLHVFLDKIIAEQTLPLVTPMAARKDSYLLDLKWGEMADVREWDRPHLNHEHYDEEESYRCWLVGAQILNHYYGGNITQDEIKLNFKGNSNLFVLRDSVSSLLLGAFLHYSQGGVLGNMSAFLEELLPWVLNENASLNITASPPTEQEVISWLNKSVPLYVWTNHHVMVLDAFKRTLTGNLFVRLVNTDNDGSVAWVSLSSSEIMGFAAPVVSGIVRMSNLQIHTDTDNDGLMDYDEIMRFGTDPNNADSDGDGIDDKTEIYSYTILEPVPDSNRTIWKMGITKLSYADIDNDGIRAELDFDSDNGGVSDGIEDLNRNGISEQNETSPYNAEDDFIETEIAMNVPDSLVFYALGDLRINDGVACRYLLKNCNIASESKNKEYAVYIGRSTKVRRIDTKGGVFLRDFSIVTGNIRFFSLPQQTLDVTKQNNVKYDRISFSKFESLWPYKVKLDLAQFVSNNEIKEVFYNQTYSLKNGDVFKSLKVHSGGTLLVEPGIMNINNIQLESGSRVEFVSPGNKTIINTKGNVIWRARTSNENLEDVARGFKLIQHGSESMIIEGLWAGTIIAPNADLVLGQSNKLLYGKFLGKSIDVHQYSTVYGVKFAPDSIETLVFKGE